MHYAECKYVKNKMLLGVSHALPVQELRIHGHPATVRIKRREAHHQLLWDGTDHLLQVPRLREILQARELQRSTGVEREA